MFTLTLCITYHFLHTLGRPPRNFVRGEKDRQKNKERRKVFPQNNLKPATFHFLPTLPGLAWYSLSSFPWPLPLRALPRPPPLPVPPCLLISALPLSQPALGQGVPLSPREQLALPYISHFRLWQGVSLDTSNKLCLYKSHIPKRANSGLLSKGLVPLLLLK